MVYMLDIHIGIPIVARVLLKPFFNFLYVIDFIESYFLSHVEHFRPLFMLFIRGYLIVIQVIFGCFFNQKASLLAIIMFSCRVPVDHKSVIARLAFGRTFVGNSLFA